METTSLSPMPRDSNIDSTLALLCDGYTFISRRCQLYRSDVFQTRLMLRKVICTMGAEAAGMFYHAGRFTRRRAVPPTALMLLQDKGSMQLLDGDAHRWRKQMFMSLMSPTSIQQLARIAADQWRAQIGKWETVKEVVLLYEVQEIFCRAVCNWAGVRLTELEARQRTRDLGGNDRWGRCRRPTELVGNAAPRPHRAMDARQDYKDAYRRA